MLFSGSIFDNIKYSIYNSLEAESDRVSMDRSGRIVAEPLEQRVERAAKIAHAHDFIIKLPHGYAVSLLLCSHIFMCCYLTYTRGELVVVFAYLFLL